MVRLIQTIDLSKAFDCVKRDKLMAIMEAAEIVNEDEKRLLLYLLSDTRIRVAIGNVKGEYFKSTIGLPQGDALSPVLFVIYLEHIMLEQTRRYPFRDNRRDYVVQQYADDTTLAYHQPKLESEHATIDREGTCRCAKCAIECIHNALPVTMAEYKMIMNKVKTEFETLDRSRQEEIKIKFLVTKLNVRREEIKTRRMQAKQAMRIMRNIWEKRKIVREELRVRLYRACVEPHLMLSTIPTKSTEIEELNIEHRKGMKIALGIYYPHKIGNIALYKRTGTESISV